MEKIRYQKLGGGILEFHGKNIRRGETFKAYPGEIPDGFKDIVQPLEEIPDPDKIVAGFHFEVRHKGGGWYDVINTISGKTVNNESLRVEKARELIKSLGNDLGNS